MARVKTEIRLDDRARLIDFGDQAQRSVTDYAERVLRQTTNKERGDTGELLTDIIAKAKGLDLAILENAGFFERLLGSLERRILKFRAKKLTDALQSDAFLNLAWTEHGFRGPLGAVDSSSHAGSGFTIPQTLTAIVPMPEAAVMLVLTGSLANSG